MERDDDVYRGIQENMLMLTELMTPVFDAADGVKANMISRGWSPEAAERAALEWLINSIKLSFAGAFA
jgi:hypothetical protein